MSAFAQLEDLELIVLLRTFVAAKFSPVPRDAEIITSPIAAKLCNEIADLVAEREVREHGTVVAGYFEDWRQLTPQRDEWEIALELADKHLIPYVKSWNEADRRSALSNFLAPFVMSRENTEKFCSLIHWE